jgi:predicted transcriptional regulator
MICQLFSKPVPLRSSDLAVLVVGIVIVIVAVVILSEGARLTQTFGAATTSLNTFSSLSYSAPSTTTSNMTTVTISNTTVTVQPPIAYPYNPYPYTATAPYAGLILLTVSIVVFGAAFVRIHDYRTRIHIYHEIIQYVAQSPRIPSHIMRKCNLETGKFQKYISILGDRGFVQKVPADGDHYRATDKAIDYLRDRKLSEFLSELR